MNVEDLLHAPPRSVIPNETRSRGECKKIVVVTKDGRQFNLGSPQSIWFPLRRRWYLWRRRKENVPSQT